jgi:hypothetical protein
MRIHKIKGYKNCVRCGIKFSYFNNRSVYCGRECEQKYRLGKDGNKKITLAFIPKHLMEERHED